MADADSERSFRGPKSVAVVASLVLELVGLVAVEAAAAAAAAEAAPSSCGDCSRCWNDGRGSGDAFEPSYFDASALAEMSSGGDAAAVAMDAERREIDALGSLAGNEDNRTSAG